MSVLLERVNAGLYVELIWLGDNKVALRVKDNDKDEVVVMVDPNKAKDAFDHPHLYIYDESKMVESRDIVAAIREYGK